METIGYLTIDVDSYILWYKNHAFAWLCDKWEHVFYELTGSHPEYRKAYKLFSGDCAYDYATQVEYLERMKSKFDSKNQDYISAVQDRCEYSHKFNQRIRVVDIQDSFYAVKFGKDIFIFPTSADGLEYHPLKDYDMITGKDLSKLCTSDPSTSSVNLPAMKSIHEKQTELESKESELMAREKAIKDGCAEEVKDLQDKLQKLQDELESKKQSLLEELNKKQEELAAKKAELDQQIYILETQIYAIRCYTGEVVDFVQLRKGEHSNEQVPLVLYQKLRYLDEEMGRFCIRYDFDFEDIHYFEEFLSRSNEAFDTFCPSEKCVSLVKISKDNNVYANHAKYLNMLQSYEVEHGATIGVLIRDKDNLYVCWTDDSRIRIEDDMFYVPSTTYDDSASEVSIADKRHALTEMTSRYFIFNLLQGCVDNTSCDGALFSLPEGTDVTVAGPYVVYSSADGWIDTNKYENLGYLIDKCNELSKVGDKLIITLNLSGGDYGAYHNERGRGIYNRTGGLYVSNGSIDKLNLIDHEGSTITYDTGLTRVEKQTQYDSISQEYVTVEKPISLIYRHTFDNNDTMKSALEDLEAWLLAEGLELDASKVVWNIKNNFYISVLKDDSSYVYDGGRFTDRQKNSYSNFRLDSDEFMNIELLNSAWIEYFVDSKKVHDVRVGGCIVNYSYLILYLNKAITRIREREEHEMALLIEAGFRRFDDIDWRDRLSRYKMSSGHHVLKPRWAKQFAKQLNEELDSKEE